MRNPIGIITYSLHPQNGKTARKWNLAAFEVYGEESDAKLNPDLRRALPSLNKKHGVIGAGHWITIDYVPYTKLPKRGPRVPSEGSFLQQAVEEFELTEAEQQRNAGANRPLYKQMLDPKNRGEIFSLSEKRIAEDFKAEISEVSDDVLKLLGFNAKRLME